MTETVDTTGAAGIPRTETGAEVPGVGRQLWLASLGVVVLAGKGVALVGKGIKQGGRAIDVLVEQGKEFEPTVTGGLSRVRDEMGEVTGKLKSAVGQAEANFDDKVRESLQRLGVPTAEDVRKLAERVDVLASQLEQEAEEKHEEGSEEGKRPSRRRAGG